ncbi:hypothetical protein EI94DRAFT_1753086 [Lactarius quietus]|nr:hypothetical protein EI94DRAFT_1753086 [Lactarius quietus]
MTAPTTTTENAIPITTAIEPIRAGKAPEQGVGPEESRVADTSAQGSTESPETSPTSATGKVPWKDQKTRGASSLKEHGDQILTGEASAWEPTRKE